MDWNDCPASGNRHEEQNEKNAKRPCMKSGDMIIVLRPVFETPAQQRAQDEIRMPYHALKLEDTISGCTLSTWA